MRTCAQCGKVLQGRADAVYCSSACKQRAYRIRNAKPVTDREPAPADSRNTPPVTDKEPTPADSRNAPPVTDATVIDYASLPPKAKEREAVLRRVIRRELEKEYRAQLAAECARYRAECDATLAAYKAKLDADARQQRATRDEERGRYQQVVDARKGIITKADFNLIRSCLHPDSRLQLQADDEKLANEKLANAFRVFNEAKILFLNEKDFPTRRSNLPSWEELQRRRAERQEKERAARAAAKAQKQADTDNRPRDT